MRRLLQSLLLVAVIVLTTTLATAQLSGTKTIPGDYATIADAITALNTSGVGSGGVTFNVAAAYTETAANLTLTDSSASAANPVVFQKSGVGANPLITAAAGTGATDGIIKIAGTDYVTFDAIDLQENAANITTTTQMEWGYAIVKANANNGSQNITIKNCTITLNKANTSSVGVYAGNHTATSTTSLTVTAASGTNSNQKIFSNTITNSFIGISLSGFAASTPYTLYDQNNEVGVSGTNTITNFGGSSTTTAYGIYAIYQNGIKVNNNSINNAGGLLQKSTLTGIFLSTGTSSNVDVVGNTITLTDSATTSTMTGISNAMGSTAAGNTVRIRSNTVQNCSYPSATSGAFTGIINSASAATVNIDSNVVRNNILPGTGTFTGIDGGSPTTLTLNANNVYGNQKTGTSGPIYCTRGSTAAITYSFNNVYNNTGLNASFTGAIYGYYNISSPTLENYFNNTIDSLIVGGAGTIYGLYTFSTSTTPKNIYNNNIYKLLSAGGTIYGMYNASGATVSIYRNKLYDFTSGTGASALVYGIYISSGTTIYIYNNFVSDLKAPAATGTIAVNGLYIGGGTTVGAYYNSIYLNTSSSSVTTFGTSGIYASTTPTVDLRDNIAVNLSAPGPTGGFTVAYRRSSTTLTSYAAASNKNDFYVRTADGARRYFYSHGATTADCDSVFAAFQTRVTPRDAGSFAENPPFVNVATTPYDLHMQTGTPTQTESGGIPITTPLAITADYDGDLRNASAPDVGADEFAGTGLDLSPPNIAYTPLTNTASTSGRTLPSTITDPSGVPTSGIGLPVLYWKIRTSGTYTPATATFGGGSSYSFTFGSGVVTGDTVYYYVCAQDNAAAQNVGSFPGGGSGYTPNPPAAATPPSTPSSYIIVGSLSGTKTVGIGGDYATLKAAFDDINGKVVTGALTLQVLSSGTTEATTAALNQVSYDGGPFTITISPAPATTPTITGTIAGAIIKLNGADNVVIDGSNSGGSDRSLSITNASTTGTAIWLASLGTGAGATSNTIRNCIIQSGGIASGSYGIFIGGATIGSAGDDNDFVTVQNDSISKAYYGVYAAASAAGVMNNLFIRNNSIGCTTLAASQIGFTGIYVSYGTGGDISQNKVFNIIGTAVNPRGINIQTGFVSATVSRNDIHSIRYTGTGGYGGKGIEVSTGSATSALIIANNIIYDILGDGWSSLTGDAIVGVRILGTTGGVGFYFNTVALSGTFAGNSSGTLSAALYIDAAATNINIRDNILATSLVNSVAPTAKTYAVYSAAPSGAYTDINYNDYFASGTQGVLGYLGADQTTIGAWQTATGKDARSIASDPLFSGPTNFVPFEGSPVLSAGVTIGGITVDFTGATRNDPPSMGAYENGVPSGPPNCATNVSPADGATNIPRNATLNWGNGGGSPSGYKLSFGTDNPPTNIVNGADLGNVLTYTPVSLLSYSTTYYWKVVAYNTNGDATGCAVWSFNTMADPTITTFPWTENFDGVTPPALPNGWAIENTNADGNVWRTTTTSPRSAPNSMYIVYNTSLAMDDWAFTPPLHLTSGVQYSLRFWYKAYSASFPERLEVKWGTSASSAGMTLGQLFVNANITNTSYLEGTGTLTPVTTGTYYIGFHGYSAADMFDLFFDDVSLTAILANDVSVASVDTPATSAINNVAITPKARVYNNGTNMNTFPVNLKIKKFDNTVLYDRTMTVTNLASGSFFDVVFDQSWTPTDTTGVYVATAVTQLGGDQNSLNDTINKNFRVISDPRTNTVPDGGGWMYSASNSTGSPRPSYTWINSGPVSPMAADSLLAGTQADDFLSGVVRLPSPFTFYGIPCDSIQVSTNGWLAFVDAATLNNLGTNSFTSEALIPDINPPNYIIAPLWDDLDTVSSYGTSGIYVKHNVPTNEFVIEWFHFGTYNSGGALGDMCFQVVLNLTNNTININYASLADGGFTYPGAGTQGSVGIEGSGAPSLASETHAGFPVYGDLNGKVVDLKHYPEFKEFVAEWKKHAAEGNPRNSVLAGAQGTGYYFQGNRPFNTPATGVSIIFSQDIGLLPIQLWYLNAIRANEGRSVRVEWGTLSEVNNYGFEVQKALGNPVNFQTIPNSFIPGHGTTNEQHRYEFTDNSVSAGVWYYRIKQIDLDRTVHFTDPVRIEVLTDVPESAPKVFALFQNYPNPFNPETTIKFSVERTDHTTLQLYNMFGQTVATLFDGVAEAGFYYKMKFSGQSLASGVYFYRLQSGKKSDLKKLLLLK